MCWHEWCSKAGGMNWRGGGQKGEYLMHSDAHALLMCLYTRHHSAQSFSLIYISCVLAGRHTLTSQPADSAMGPAKTSRLPPSQISRGHPTEISLSVKSHFKCVTHEAFSDHCHNRPCTRWTSALIPSISINADFVFSVETKNDCCLYYMTDTDNLMWKNVKVSLMLAFQCFNLDVNISD